MLPGALLIGLLGGSVAGFRRGWRQRSGVFGLSLLVTLIVHWSGLAEAAPVVLAVLAANTLVGFEVGLGVVSALRLVGRPR